MWFWPSYGSHGPFIDDDWLDYRITSILMYLAVSNLLPRWWEHTDLTSCGNCWEDANFWSSPNRFFHPGSLVGCQFSSIEFLVIRTLWVILISHYYDYPIQSHHCCPGFRVLVYSIVVIWQIIIEQKQSFAFFPKTMSESVLSEASEIMSESLCIPDRCPSILSL